MPRPTATEIAAAADMIDHLVTTYGCSREAAIRTYFNNDVDFDIESEANADASYEDDGAR